MVTATAIAQIAQLAPGRLAVGVGTGFTGSCLLGQNAMRWKDVAHYVDAVQTLLRGGDFEWDGAMMRMCHPNGFVPDRPVEVPWIVGAEGPKGREVARRFANGVCVALADPPEEFDWVAKLTFGTVLDEGEPATSDRAFEAAGFGAAMAYHLYYQWQGLDSLDQLPGGAQWRDEVVKVPENIRHFTAHEGHAVY